MKIRLDTLGSGGLRNAAGQDVTAVLAQPKRLALLVYLALARPRGFHRRDRLLAVFWPEADQERARRALRDSVYFLRRELGENALPGRGNEELALDQAVVETDAAAFENAIESGDLRGALSLYRGELLPGFHVVDAPDFERWLDEERVLLARSAVTAARTLRDAAAKAGRPEESVALARRAHELNPTDELDCSALITLLNATGDRAGALATFGRYEERLASELGISPSPALLGLIVRIRQGEAPPATPAPVPPTRPPETRSSPAVTAAPAAAPASAQQSRRWLGLLTGGAALIALTLTLSRAPGEQPVQPADVLVMPFSVHGSSDVEFLAEGMVDLLSPKLDGPGEVRSVDPQALMAQLTALGPGPRDLALGRALSARFGGASFVMGSVIEAGGRLQVSAYLYDRDGKQVARADGLAPSDDLFTLVDDIARQLLAGRLDRPESEVAGVAARSTKSLPALRAYLEGEQLFRRGDYGGAEAAFARAVAADTAFALAYYRQSSAADWSGRAEIARAAVERAARHQGRLPRQERAFVSARAHYWSGDAAEAEATYSRLVSARPTSVEAWQELAEVRFHAGPWMGRSIAESEGPFREVLRLVPTHVAAMVHLARVAALSGRTALLDSLLRSVDLAEPGHPRILELRALEAALSRDSVAIERVATELADADLALLGAVAERVAVYTGHLRAAERIARPMISAGLPRQERLNGYEILSHLVMGQGRRAEARELVAALERLEPVRGAHTRAAMATAIFAAPDADELRRTAVSLDRLPATPRPAPGDAAEPYQLEAMRRGYYRGTVALLLGDSATMRSRLVALERDAGRAGDAGLLAAHFASLLRARALKQEGRTADALAVLEAGWPPARRGVMLGWAWSHVTVAARYLRATLLSDLGRAEEASAWYASAFEDIAGTPLYLEAIRAARGRRINPRSG